MTKIIKIHFSPSETTKKVVEQVAENFDFESEAYDLLNFDSKKEFSSEDIAIVGMPVFAGRIPKNGRARLEKLKGDNTKAIAIANYGNAHVTDALLELVDLLNENGFDVIAAATTISHHSIFDGVAIGRPDSEDIAKINEFAGKCKDKIASGKTLESEIRKQTIHRLQTVAVHNKL